LVLLDSKYSLNWVKLEAGVSERRLWSFTAVAKCLKPRQC